MIQKESLVSDVLGTPPGRNPLEPSVDPAFVEAWNSVYDPSDTETPGESGANGGAAGAGTPEAAPTGQGAADNAGEPAAPASGAPTPDGTDAPNQDPTGAGAADGAKPDEPPADSSGSNDPGTAHQGTTQLTYAEVAPKFAEAAAAIDTNITEAFKRQATQEVNDLIGERWTQPLSVHPRLLVGQEVPSLRDPNATEKILDSKDAAEWQEAAKSLIQAEIDSKIEQRREASKEMLTVIQESVLMFQNNQDLVPGTAEFDKELADEFASIVKDYEFRIDGKLYGYHVNVQPLINNLRSRLATQRGASGATAAAQAAARAAQAQAQARNDQGQFVSTDLPQAGIPSKAGSQGEAVESYEAFWQTLGFPSSMIV